MHVEPRSLRFPYLAAHPFPSMPSPPSTSPSLLSSPPILMELCEHSRCRRASCPGGTVRRISGNQSIRSRWDSGTCSPNLACPVTHKLTPDDSFAHPPPTKYPASTSTPPQQVDVFFALAKGNWHCGNPLCRKPLDPWAANGADNAMCIARVQNYIYHDGLRGPMAADNNLRTYRPKRRVLTSLAAANARFVAPTPRAVVMKAVGVSSPLGAPWRSTSARTQASCRSPVTTWAPCPP